MATDPQSDATNRSADNSAAQNSAAEIPDNPVEEQLEHADAAEVEHADEVIEDIESADAHAADAGPDELAE